MSDPARNMNPMTPAQLLDFERRHPHATPDKHARIRHELGISEIRYYVLLARAAESVDGIAADPFTARVVRERAYKRARERERRIAS
ncbi:DUF3263 domain-containing protein [Microbacterium sp. NPDC088619]|uniref:DUF3263 domain-containing protein n=1 Tax=Microbacterium sp. NPDC088619 TaxID=3364196 RepID=UPI003827630C